MGHGFMKNLYHHSSASMAWTIWTKQYTKVNIESYKETYEAERLSYRGGLTISFKIKGGWGICLDINSSYPAAMCNIMPWRFI